jgi:hypothetical protein
VSGLVKTTVMTMIAIMTYQFDMEHQLVNHLTDQLSGNRTRNFDTANFRFSHCIETLQLINVL